MKPMLRYALQAYVAGCHVTDITYWLTDEEKIEFFEKIKPNPTPKGE